MFCTSLLRLILLCVCLSFAAPAKAQSAAPERKGLIEITGRFDAATQTRDQGAKVTLAEQDGRMRLEITAEPPKQWPGVYFPAPGGKWDLSAYNRVEVVLTNKSDEPAKVACRVDDDPKADGQKHSNTEGVTLKPGESKTVRITFGRSYGGNPAWNLDRKNVVGVLVFIDSPKKATTVAIHDIRAASGDLPGQVRIVAGADWQPIEHHLLVDKGSALDFSFLADAPAGKHGRVVIRDGHFEFADRPGERARFYGTNVVYGANFPTHARADAMAEELLRIGYNSLRFHHFDQILLDKNAADSLTFDAEKLDRLDYFFAACKKRGIYITIDLYATRELKAGEVPELPGKLTGQACKGAVQLLDSARGNWEEFSRRLLNHVNPYTNLAWKDDPALYLVCLLNEGNVYQTWNASAPLKALYQARFDQWLTAQGKQPADDAQRQVAFNEFLTELQRKWFAHGQKFLRDLGYNSTITDANYISMRTHALVRTDLDVVDIHGYWAAGEFMGEWGNSPLRTSPRDLVAAGADMPVKALVSRLFGKPFAITEFNAAYPNEYRASSGPVFGGLAAFHDIDALYRFDYIGTVQETPKRIYWLSTANDPIQMLSERLGILMFLRADLRPAQAKIPYLVTDNYLQNPKALDWSHWYPDPFAYSALWAQIGTIVPRDGSLRTPAKFAVTTESIAAEKFPGLKLLDPPTAANPAKLRELGLLPQPDPSKPEQFKLDRKAGTLSVITERSECLIVSDSTKSLNGKVLRVDDADTHATVAVASLDGNPLESSRRLLILHLTNIANSGTLYRDDTKTVLENYGDLPLLARKGSAKLTLAGSGWQNAKLHALDLAGKRLGEVPLQQSPGGVSFTLSTHRPAGTCMAYELER